MKKTRNLFICLYFMSYLGFAFAMTQYTPYLAKLGYPEWQRGILLSSYAVTTILFQLIFGFLSDRFHTIKRFIMLAYGIFAVSLAAFFLTRTPVFGLHIGLVAVSGGLVNTCCGLYDTWILASGKEISANLSFVKTFGSIGWGIGSVILTYILHGFGYTGLSITVLLLGILGILICLSLKDITYNKTEKVKVNKADYRQLLTDHRYVLLVVILFLMYCVIMCSNTTVVDKMLFLGASDKQIAYKWSIQSFIEIPTYLAGGYLLGRFNHYSLLKISAIALTIQFCLYGFVDNISIMIAVGVLQMLTTPLLLITSKTLIFKLTPNNMKSSGQLFALSIFTGVSSLVIPAGAGIMTSIFSAKVTLLLAAGLAVLAFILLFRLEKMASQS